MSTTAHYRLKHYLFLATLLLGWGLLKLPWEHRLQQEQAIMRYHGLALNTSLRDQLGQGATLAALAGMRGLVASYIWCVEVETCWEQREWFKLKSLVELVTTLEPRSAQYWDEGAWQFAWNAALDRRRNPDQPSELLRLRDERFWVDQGVHLLERGIQNNPEKMVLWWKLGFLYEQRKQDYGQAAECYKQALLRPNPPQFLERFVGYDLEKTGDFAGAYAWWKGIWFSTPDHTQKVRAWDWVEAHIRSMEDKLAIPPEKRVFPDAKIRNSLTR